MSERPNEPPNDPPDHEGDDLTEAGFEDDEPTVESGDAELQGVDDEVPVEGVTGDAGVADAVLGGEAAVTRPMRPSERKAMRAAMEHGQVTLDPAHRVSDRASAAFVLVTVGIFVLILLNGLALGHGGFLTPIPTPSAIPAVTASPLPSAAPVPSGSPVPIVTPAPTATPVPTATPAPSATPGAS
jgi:hypothetical protein